MAKNKKSPASEKKIQSPKSSSKKRNIQKEVTDTEEKQTTEIRPANEPTNEVNEPDANILNEKNASPDKASEIKDVDPQDSEEESASEKDIETKEIPQENDTRQPLETEDEVPSLEAYEDESDEVPPNTNCKCMQKKPGGKYFCFRLVQGRWIQSSAIPFDTKEFCEEICC